MTGSIGKLAVVVALFFCPSLAIAGEVGKPKDIEAALLQIRDAAIASKPEMAAALFAEDLALISQSGKLYGKEAALFDLRNGFNAWENSEIVVRKHGHMAIVTLINNRTRAGMEPAKFLVMQVWRKEQKSWQLSAQSSVRIAKKISPVSK